MKRRRVNNLVYEYVSVQYKANYIMRKGILGIICGCGGGVETIAEVQGDFPFSGSNYFKGLPVQFPN